MPEIEIMLYLTNSNKKILRFWNKNINNQELLSAQINDIYKEHSDFTNGKYNNLKINKKWIDILYSSKCYNLEVNYLPY